MEEETERQCGYREARARSMIWLTTVATGLATIVAAGLWGPSELTWLGFTALMLLGLSFLVGGVVGNPGCELTALPNLVLPSRKRLHCL